MTFETVRRIAQCLAGSEEGTSYGTPAFKVHGVLFVRLREDGESLVVRTTHEQREALIADDPRVYFLEDHYLDYPWVLIHLSFVHPDALTDLLGLAWKLALETKKRPPRPASRSPRRRVSRVKK